MKKESPSFVVTFTLPKEAKDLTGPLSQEIREALMERLQCEPKVSYGYNDDKVGFCVVVPVDYTPDHLIKVSSVLEAVLPPIIDKAKRFLELRDKLQNDIERQLK